ncbi:MAG: cytochrome b5 domain-containing protein [Clostridium perfringens]|nr:cytochrome b5 domain-containing protein [Clostridium perfringens]
MNFYEEKFEEINRLKDLMTSSNTKEDYNKYKSLLEKELIHINKYNRMLQQDGVVTMNREELRHYTGDNGTRKYVAVNGIIYDLTDTPQLEYAPHCQIVGGTDVTKMFSNCHGDDYEILEKLPKVGILI